MCHVVLQGGRQLGRARTATSQWAGSAGISSRCTQRARTAAADLAPHPARPGKSVRAVAHEGGYRGWTRGRRRTWPRPRLVDDQGPCVDRVGRRVAATHWPRSLSGVQMITCSTPASSSVTAATLARASSASSSTIGHTTTPSATSASSSGHAWDHRSGSTPSRSCSRATARCGRTRSRGRSPRQHGWRRRQAAGGPNRGRPRTAATSLAGCVAMRRGAKEVAEQLVGPVDEVHLHRWSESLIRVEGVELTTPSPTAHPVCAMPSAPPGLPSRRPVPRTPRPHRSRNFHQEGARSVTPDR